VTASGSARTPGRLPCPGVDRDPRRAGADAGDQPGRGDGAADRDGNTTAAFVCRPIRGRTTWSAHAYGLAIDVNPFQNPYTSGQRVLPELATAYLDRGRHLPGMITADGPVAAAFRSVGWTWGGGWSSPTDLMHFSSTGH